MKNKKQTGWERDDENFSSLMKGKVRDFGSERKLNKARDSSQVGLSDIYIKKELNILIN